MWCICIYMGTPWLMMTTSLSHSPFGFHHYLLYIFLYSSTPTSTCIFNYYFRFSSTLLSLSMADLYSLCLIGVMDRLWFQHIILFSESDSDSSTVPFPISLKQQTPLISEFLVHLPSSSTPSSATSIDQEIEINKNKREGDCKVIVDQKERPKRLNIGTNRVRSHSSSTSSQKHGPKYIRSSCSLRKLEKSMSFRSLGELELEEVKGFMDLGFVFKKEHISPRMISVVPGLVRLELNKKKQNPEEDDDIKREEHEEEKGIIRPYLSESWIIKKPNSPLLNLRLPRVSAAADMKKHLKFWARTVASVTQQES